MDGKKVTRLAVQKKNQKRVNVYLDDEFAFGLSTYLALPLSIGQILSEEKINELLAADHDETVYLRAVSFLDARPRTEGEIRKKLKTIGCEEPDIEKVIARLKECGLVNDEQFSHLWVEDRNLFKPRSRRALRYELKQKGVPEEIIQQALENTDDYRAAFVLADQRKSRWSGLEWKDFKQKAGNYLAGKGFGYDVVRETLRQLWDQMNAEDVDSEDETEELGNAEN